MTDKEYRKAYYKNHREEINTKQRRYNKTENGKLVNRRLHLKKVGLTLEQYDKMFEAQGGVCAICKLPELIQRLTVDHNHKTGKIRGLVCNRCNKLLGFASDNIKILETAIEYLVCNSKL